MEGEKRTVSKEGDLELQRSWRGWEPGLDGGCVGEQGGGLAEKSLITQEVWNSDLRPHSGADATMVKM